MADNKNPEDKVASPDETEDQAVIEQSTATAATTQVTHGTTGMLPAQHWLEAAEEVCDRRMGSGDVVSITLSANIWP